MLSVYVPSRLKYVLVFSDFKMKKNLRKKENQNGKKKTHTVTKEIMDRESDLTFEVLPSVVHIGSTDSKTDRTSSKSCL